MISKKINFNNLINIILGVFVVYVLSLRIPGWISNFKIENTPSSQFKALNLKDNSQIKFPIEDGKPHVLIFWATWCGPCSLELSLFQKAIDNKELPADQIHAISLGEDPELVRQVSADRKYTFMVYVDTDNLSSRIYNISGTPTIVHLNKDGIVSWIGTGISPLAINRAKTHLGM